MLGFLLWGRSPTCLFRRQVEDLPHAGAPTVYAHPPGESALRGVKVGPSREEASSPVPAARLSVQVVDWARNSRRVAPDMIDTSRRNNHFCK